MYLNHLIAFIGTLGTPELLVILGIIILLFGAKKIPQLAKGLGSSLTEFRKGRSEYSKDRDKVEKNSE